MNGFAEDVKRILTAHGWKLVRAGKGSHEIWGHPNSEKPPVTVPQGCKSRHLANRILKDAGINQKL